MAHALADGPTPAGMPPRSDSFLRRYGVAVVATLVAGLGTIVLRSAMVLPHAIAAFLAAILLTGWYAGFGPATLALVLCAALDAWLPAVPSPRVEAALGLRHVWFLFFALAAGYFGTVRRRTTRELQQAHDRLEEKVVVRTAQLREGERKLSEAERLAHLAYWEVDQDANRVSLSDEGRRIFGLPPDPTSWPWDEFLARVHVDDRALVERARARVMAGETSFRFGYRIIRFDGEVRYVEKIVDVDRDATGRPFRAIGALQDVTERHRAEEALREARDRLQHLSRRLLDVQEQERRHLARELHDEFGQLLATIGLHLHAARTLSGDALRSRLDECDILLRRAGDEVRGLALELRPLLLESSGLDATVRWHAEQQQRATGTPIEVRGHLGEVPEEAAIALFRVVQEALTNVARHAGARHAWIDLSQGDDVLEIAIRDDGIGFDVGVTMEHAAASDHTGIVGMGERVELLGGTLIVESEPGSGTVVRVSIPMRDALGGARGPTGEPS